MSNFTNKISNYCTKRLLVACWLAVVSSSAGWAQGVPEMMYFKFNQITGTQTPNDAPAATMAGNPTATVTGMTIGGTGQFLTGLQGTAGTLTAQNVNPGWTGTWTGSWTISFWMNVPTPPTTRYMFGNSTGGGTFRCFIGGAAQGIRLTGGTPSITLDMPNWQPGISVVTYVYDQTAGTVSGYINGVFQTSVSPGLSYPLVGTNFYIGNQVTSIDGTMDEFRMYNRALGQTEITNTWDEQLPLYNGPNNAGITELTSPVNFCSGVRDIKVKVKNWGSNVLNSLQVQWKLNGVAQTPYTINTPLDTIGGTGINEQEVLLGTYNFLPGTAVNFSSNTYLPNGVPDPATYNDSLNTVLHSALSGTFTINSALPTSGNNYANFTSFASDLNNYGICGPVVANVQPGSGPYVETVTLGNIAGTSAINTIKINGNGATVQYTNTATQVPILTLSGSKYVKVDSLTFKSLSTGYGYGVLITSGASYDSITRCTFDLTSLTTTTAANASGIVFSASNTSPTTAGVNGSKCFIGNNKILSTTGSGGAYYGIAVSGASDSNTLYRNTIGNFYMYGIYISGATGTKVIGNDVHRSTKTSVTTFYGVYTTGVTEGTLISANRVHDPAGSSVSSTSSFYGIYNLGDATSAAPTKIFNNAVYNINIGGIIYGIYNSTAPYANIYHNTVVIDKVLTGTSANYGIATTGDGTVTNIYNNLVSITQGTLGIKYGFYYSAANSTDNAQRNNIYVNSAQTGVQNYGYYTTAYLTQAAFQTAYPALEQGSLTINPQFTNAATGNLLPTNVALMGNGMNLLSQVPTDILGAPRGSLPTPGAFEIPATPGPNAGLLASVTPSVPFCAGPQPVQVSVVNSGTVQLNNFQVFWTLNNVAQPTFSFNGMLDTFNGAGQYIDTVNLGTVNIPAGNNTIKAWIVIAGDVNHLNDTLNVTVTPTNFVINSPTDTLCAGGDATINLTPETGYATGMIQWESSVDGNIFNPISNANTPVYTAANMSATRYFRVFINSGTQGCTSNVKKINIVSPAILSVIDSFNCGPGTVTIGANPASGSSIRWFSAPSGGDPIATGNYFTTPALSATTTYYAQAATGGGLGSVGPLNPAAVGTNAGTAAPIATYYMAFDVIAPTTLVSVDIFPTAAVGSNGGIVIQNSASTVIATIPFTTTVTGGTTPQTITLNLPLPPGTGYKMGQLAPAINLIRNSAGAIYPYTSAAVNIVSNNFGPAYYYYFYNWQFTSGCEGPRVPVVASVNAIPDVNLGPDVISCTDGTTTVTLNAGITGAQYLWSNNATTQTTAVTTSGNYNVKVTKDGCIDRDTIAVIFNPNPVVNIGPDSTICDGQNVMLNAGNQGAAYLWDNGTTNMVSFAATAGNHFVRVTNANNCVGSDTMNLTVIPAPDVDLGSDTTVCAGVVLTLDADNPGLLFLWNDGSTLQTLQALDSGTYYVKVTSPGCFRMDTINIAYYLTPEADGINAVYMDSATYYFTPINPQYATGYIWDFGDGSPLVTGAFVQHTYATNGIYSVKLSLVGNCDSVLSANIKTVDVFDAAGGTGTGIKDINNKNGLVIYPNPGNGLVTIESKSAMNIEAVELYSIAGQRLINKQFNASKVSIDASHLASGIYLIKVLNKDGSVFLQKIEIRK